MATNTVKPEAKYTVEDLFTAYIAYDRRQKPLGGPGHETPEASWKTVQLRMPENWLRARSYGDGYGRRLYTLTLITALNRSVWGFRRNRSLFPSSCRSLVPRSCRSGSERSDASICHLGEVIGIRQESFVGFSFLRLFCRLRVGLGWAGA